MNAHQPATGESRLIDPRSCLLAQPNLQIWWNIAAACVWLYDVSVFGPVERIHGSLHSWTCPCSSRSACLPSPVFLSSCRPPPCYLGVCAVLDSRSVYDSTTVRLIHASQLHVCHASSGLSSASPTSSRCAALRCVRASSYSWVIFFPVVVWMVGKG